MIKQQSVSGDNPSSHNYEEKAITKDDNKIHGFARCTLNMKLQGQSFQYAALMCEMFGTKMQQYHLKPLFHDRLNKTKLEKLTLWNYSLKLLPDNKSWR